MEKKTAEDYLRKWASFEFDQWKESHPQAYKLIIKSIEDVIYEKESELLECRNKISQLNKENSKLGDMVVDNRKLLLRPNEREQLWYEACKAQIESCTVHTRDGSDVTKSPLASFPLRVGGN